VSFCLEKGTNAVGTRCGFCAGRSRTRARRASVSRHYRGRLSGHLWRKTAPSWQLSAGRSTAEVTVTESPAMLASPLMGHYDAAVLHYMN